MADSSLFSTWRVFRTPPVIREESNSNSNSTNTNILPASSNVMRWLLLNDETDRCQLVKRRAPPPTSGTFLSDDGPPELQEEVQQDLLVVVDNFPPFKDVGIDDHNDDHNDDDHNDVPDDWELLSDKVSVSSSSSRRQSLLLVPRAGSVRSISSVENDTGTTKTTTTTNLPIKIQRTLSHSTIDSESGDKNARCVTTTTTTTRAALGVLGVDYIEHVVLPADTLQGLCLAYKTSGTRLRQVNQFSGSNLSSAPKKLLIPLSSKKKALRNGGYIHTQNKETKEYKIHAVMADLPADIKESEAQHYLELSDWVVEDAIRAAIEDGEWEKGVFDDDTRRTNNIEIKVVNGHITAIGAGLLKHKYKSATPKMMVCSDGMPAIATKTVRPQDVYDAASEHNVYGVELKCINTVPS